MGLLQSGRFNHVLANVEICREQEIRNEVDVVAVQRMEKEPDHLIGEWKRVAFSYM